MTTSAPTPETTGAARPQRRWWHRVRLFVLPPLVAAALLLAVRAWVLTQVNVAGGHAELGLLPGDRVLVCRTAYGLRLPAAGGQGSWLWPSEPQRGDLVAYVAADSTGAWRVGRVEALPGDTLPGTPRRVLRPATYRVGTDIVARSRLVGRLWCVSYSLDASRPWLQRLRTDRFFTALP